MYRPVAGHRRPAGARRGVDLGVAGEAVLPRTFVQAVRAYDATPEWLSKAIGYGMPVLELCLGVLLIVGIMVRIAAAVSALLLLVFLIGIIQAAARGIQLECGCFGGGGHDGRRHVLHAGHPARRRAADPRRCSWCSGA